MDSSVQWKERETASQTVLNKRGEKKITNKMLFTKKGPLAQLVSICVEDKETFAKHLSHEKGLSPAAPVSTKYYQDGCTSLCIFGSDKGDRPFNVN